MSLATVVPFEVLTPAQIAAEANVAHQSVVSALEGRQMRGLYFPDAEVRDWRVRRQDFAAWQRRNLPVRLSV